HTRFSRDWSSDVCSSDLELMAEIEQRKAAEERARLLAETDPLTGCLNRRSLPSAAEALIARCADTESAVAFVMIDLDNFKQINEIGRASCRETATAAAGG